MRKWARVWVISAISLLAAFSAEEAMEAGSAVAAETRQLRIVVVATPASHPGGTFSGSISMGQGPWSIQLPANASLSASVTKSIPTAEIGVAVQGWPAGWSFVGYLLVPDPDGTAVCTLDGPYAAANVLPAGETGHLVCVKHSYDGATGTRQLRLGVVARTGAHAAAVFTIPLSTGSSVNLPLAANQPSAVVSTTVPTSSVRSFGPVPPAGWIVERVVLIPDPTGTAACEAGLPSSGGIDVPAGSGTYLYCYELSYYAPDSPRVVGAGVFAGDSPHPGAQFEVTVAGAPLALMLPAGAQASTTVQGSIPPPGSGVLKFRALSPGWHVLGYRLFLGRANESCGQHTAGAPSPGSEVSLGPGATPHLLCLVAVYLPHRSFAIGVARD